MASALTVLEAGLALNTQSSLVNGWMPFFAEVARFFFGFHLHRHWSKPNKMPPMEAKPTTAMAPDIVMKARLVSIGTGAKPRAAVNWAKRCCVNRTPKTKYVHKNRFSGKQRQIENSCQVLDGLNALSLPNSPYA